MLPIQVHSHPPFLSALALGAVLAGCETEPESLLEGPAPTAEAPQSVRFELENTSGQIVLIEPGTGCSSAAGWVQVLDGAENILPREHDCAICLCSAPDCFACNCLAIEPVELDPGEVEIEEWDGSYYRTAAMPASAACMEKTDAPAGALIARFCVIDSRSSLLSCEDVPFTLGVDRVVRFQYR